MGSGLTRMDVCGSCCLDGWAPELSSNGIVLRRADDDVRRVMEARDFGRWRFLAHLRFDLHIDDRLCISSASESGRRGAVLRSAGDAALAVSARRLLDGRWGELVDGRRLDDWGVRMGLRWQGDG